MKHRTRPDIDIRRIVDGKETTILTVLITPQCKAVRQLMGEDYIELAFLAAEAVEFHIGDYVDDELFGRYYIAAEQMPQDDRQTAGYRYTLKLVAWYMTWGNRLFMLTHGIPSGNLIRKESEWHLTNDLTHQCDELRRNLQALGLWGDKCDFDISAEYRDRAYPMSYNGVSLISALTMIANQWETEWWVTGNEAEYTVHFGKCETGEDIPLSRDNVETMTVERNASEYANKIFIFGSRDNIPYSYRKHLSFTATLGERWTCRPKLAPDMFSTDGDEDITPSLSFVLHTSAYGGMGAAELPGKYSQTLYATQNITLQDSEEERYGVFCIPQVTFAEYGISYCANTERLTYTDPATQTTSAVTSDHWNADVKIRPFVRFILNIDGHNFTATTKIGMENPDNAANLPHLFTLEEIDGGWWQTVDSGDTARQRQQHIAKQIPALTTEAFTVRPTGRKVILRVEVGLGINTATGIDFTTFTEDKRDITLTQSGLSITAEDSGRYNATGLIDIIGAVEATHLRVFPERDSLTNQVKGYFLRFYNNGAEVTPSSPFTFSLSEDFTLGIPDAYYREQWDDPAALLHIGDSRLQLPEGEHYDDDTNPQWICRDGYIQRVGLSEMETVEMAVAFEDIYPDGKLKVTGVTEEERNTITVNDDGSKSSFLWTQYHLALAAVTGTLKFKKRYILSGETLRIRFLTPSDVQNYYQCAEAKLAGMTFECGYNTSRHITNALTGLREKHDDDFAIVRNDDFGCMLPNEILRPTVNAPCVLIGWNVKAMGGMGLITDAERRLMQRGFQYAQALEESQFTITCAMMSPFMLTLSKTEPYDLFPMGQKVSVSNAALKGGVKHSRVIGWELKLDMPFDTPKYTVGETDAYSRIKHLEKQITKLTT